LNYARICLCRPNLAAHIQNIPVRIINRCSAPKYISIFKFILSILI